MHCCKQLLAVYSKYFRKLFSEQETSSIKIADVSYNMFYLLMQQFYYQFCNDISGYEYDTLVELFVLANKFAISILQEKCERNIQVDENNFR